MSHLFVDFVITSKQNRLHSRKSLHEAYRDCTALHSLLILQNSDVCYFLFIEKITQSTHSGTSHCPGMDLAGTRDISFHSGTVPGNPGHLVTLIDTIQYNTIHRLVGLALRGEYSYD